MMIRLSFMRRLTFELRRDRRQDARPGLAEMYRVPPARAWWPAVGPRLERRVRPHFPRAKDWHYLRAPRLPPVEAKMSGGGTPPPRGMQGLSVSRSESRRATSLVLAAMRGTHV